MTSSLPGEITDAVFLPEDQAICEDILRSAKRINDQDTSFGELVLSTGLHFLGAPYAANTIEQGAAEPLVANLRAFDCITFVETVTAAALTIQHGKESFRDFMPVLEKLRYRKGLRDGYASRLHYFTDWVSDNQRLGFLFDITERLGGIPIKKGLHEITSRRNCHEQLHNKNVFRKMRAARRFARGGFFIIFRRHHGVRLKIR